MKIKGINHIAVRTNDLAQSVEFYTRLLGFRYSHECEDEQMRYVFLTHEQIGTLELLRPHDQTAERVSGHAGVDHIALDVEDVAQIEREMRKMNVELDAPYEDLPLFHTRVLKLQDPNHVVIALRQDI